jgi:halimadienyl-diphosphate synthase
MHHNILEQSLAELRQIVHDLGTEGGLVSPSIYDSAQVLRLYPPADCRPALDWLLQQQQEDCGWGDPAVPHARDVPTIGAMLALKTRDGRPAAQAAIAAGCAFLRDHADCWRGALPDSLPVGVELILPYLLEEAAQAQLDISPEPYAALIAFGTKRRARLRQMQIRGGSTHAHSWESFGANPVPDLIDGAGSVSHNPAATAAWLRASSATTTNPDLRAAAQSYLDRCCAATGMNIPGVVPGVWPLVRFEQAFVLYILFIAGLLDHPDLRDVIHAQLTNLMAAIQSAGLGLSDHFAADGDDTAAALLVLKAAGFSVELSPLAHFANENHFYAYTGELHGSVSLTARCISTLERFRDDGGDPTPYLQYVLDRQRPDGRWNHDKWHGSWIYTTLHAVLALSDIGGHEAAIQQATEALLTFQKPSGSWGTQEETAYGIFTLRTARRAMSGERIDAALARAEHWMYACHPHSDAAMGWIGKELYRPYRIVRTVELAATIPAV